MRRYRTMAAKYLKSLTREELKDFINSFDVVLSDCDGVLWEEKDAIPGSPETVKELKALGKRFFYITNNNSKTRSEFVEKCRHLNYDATLDEVVCTSFLAAMYLKEKGFDKKVYLIGNDGIAKELEAVGIEHIGNGPDVIEGEILDEILKFHPDPDVGAVVVGLDKHFSYLKIMKAMTYLGDPNVQFVGTNCDIHIPSPNCNRYPGSGCFIKSIEIASKRKAVMLGKPERYISEYIINKYNLLPSRTLMIGDNCNTDILLGKRCGFTTLLVLSGVTTKADVENFKSSPSEDDANVIPDFYTEQLSDVAQLLSAP
ncbi:glycerol-3-phosphate phosphatase-like isoform X2 [Orussus abietinus]|uniref:glycerol-3-phosphate phosphatase-like isoform X2 n=1 Tax=Orussus abietinus TaxID=222816 RepID=UPI000626335C|nr:glycerol-3-phosphate phosphatase-like isoform X2 [Orussus abietinus]